MNIEKRHKKLEKIYQKRQVELEKAFNSRLIWIALLISGLFLAAFLPTWHLGLPSLLIFGIPFIYYIQRTKTLKKHLREIKELQKFYDRQQKRKEGTYEDESYPPPILNDISNDLDLMGPRSVFTLIDETLSPHSKQVLLKLLLEGDSSKQSILDRQARTKKWQKITSQFVKWIAHTRGFIPEEQINKSENISTFENLLKSHRTFSGHKIIDIGLWMAFWNFVITFILYCYLATPSSFTVFSIAWVVFFLFSMYCLKYNSGAFFHAQSLENHLPFQYSYFHGMYKIVKSNDLPDLSEKLLKYKPQKYFSRISTLVSFLSLQSHPIILLIINAILPWNQFFANRLTKATSNLSDIYDDLKDSIAQIEVQISLVFLYTFQTKTFPTFSETVSIDAQNIFHPLIKRSEAKSNSITIHSDHPIILITGSNMSGKSTFLRTIGINQMLASMGASVFAENFQTFIGKTLTCIRVSDSIQQGASYFYSEVLRISHLLSEVKKQPSLFLIDEIFKGTNSRERLIGSKALIQALYDSKSLGLITTHDIELATTVKGLENWHFTDQTVDDVLVFDHKIKKGPAKSTNALKVMKSLGLPIEVK